MEKIRLYSYLILHKLGLSSVNQMKHIISPLTCHRKQQNYLSCKDSGLHTVKTDWKTDGTHLVLYALTTRNEYFVCFSRNLLQSRRNLFHQHLPKSTVSTPEYRLYSGINVLELTACNLFMNMLFFHNIFFFFLVKKEYFLKKCTYLHLLFFTLLSW